MDNCKCNGSCGKCNSGSCGKRKITLDNTVGIWLPPRTVEAIKNTEGIKSLHIAVVETAKDCTYYLNGDKIETIEN